MESCDLKNKGAILELRKLITDEIDAGKGSFHPADVKRLQNDLWLDNFLDFHDYNVHRAFKQCWDTLEWRKNNDVNEMSEKSVKREDLINGNVYIRGRDVDGKHILFFRVRLYSRANRTIGDLQKYFLYWVERALRISNGDKMSLVLDMQGAGLKNMDLEYTRMMVTIFKTYYPGTLNYMLVFDMPLATYAIFQIIKGLLPKQVVERMKFVNSKTAKNFVEPAHQPIEWGGSDNFELKFESEELDNGDEEGSHVNNNVDGSVDLNLKSRKEKVHFAAFQDSSSPMSETSYENHFGDMLALTPTETIMFQKSPGCNEYGGNVDITNISKRPITYKVKTTAPDKFRVRPSSGTLSPNSSATINVVIQKGQQALPINKDKFLVMCMSLPDGESLTTDEITNLWKEVTAASPDVEQHRLKCALPMNVTSAIVNNDMGIADYFLDNNSSMTSGHYGLQTSAIHNGTKPISQQQLQATVNHLSDNVNQMQQQIRSFQSLQWITIFVFVMLAIAIVYILKMEIQNQNSQYCIDK